MGMPKYLGFYQEERIHIALSICRNEEQAKGVMLYISLKNFTEFDNLWHQYASHGVDSFKPGWKLNCDKQLD